MCDPTENLVSTTSYTVSWCARRTGRRDFEAGFWMDLTTIFVYSRNSIVKVHIVENCFNIDEKERQGKLLGADSNIDL